MFAVSKLPVDRVCRLHSFCVDVDDNVYHDKHIHSTEGSTVLHESNAKTLRNLSVSGLDADTTLTITSYVACVGPPQCAPASWKW